MSRVIKDPEVRKQEILETAMKLFHEKGYDATSIADIAKAMNVVPGLCYRYFSSKKEIFDMAVKEYAKESCQDFKAVIIDRTKSFKERLAMFGEIMLTKEDNSRHHAFFHSTGNETFHLQLGIEMFKYLAPYISTELVHLNKTGEITVDDPEFLTEFILYGQMSLWLPSLNIHNNQVGSLNDRLKQITTYIYTLCNIK